MCHIKPVDWAIMSLLSYLLVDVLNILKQY